MKKDMTKIEEGKTYTFSVIKKNAKAVLSNSRDMIVYLHRRGFKKDEIIEGVYNMIYDIHGGKDSALITGTVIELRHGANTKAIILDSTKRIKITL